MNTGLTLAVSSVCLMLGVMVLAYIDNMFLPSQMVEECVDIGFPLIAKGDWWGNLFLLSGVLYIIGTYSKQWGLPELILSLTVGASISLLLFYGVYLNGKFPDALAGGGKISPAGWVVMVYTTLVLASFILFYFYSDPTIPHVVLVWILVALYLPIANHAVLGWLNAVYLYPWCPRIFAEESLPLYFIIGGEVLMVLVTLLKLTFMD